jgi:hypothetical protein
VFLERVLFSFLVFLFPLALYSLALAYVNWSTRPLLMSGLWDCIGMLFGLSGFLLFTLPMLVFGAIARLLAMLPGIEGVSREDRGWLVFIAYYSALACGTALLLAVRRRKTVVYNVDTELFRERLSRVLASLGLDHVNQSGRLIIAPAEAFAAAPEPDRASDAITADPVHVHAGREQTMKTFTAQPGGPRYAELALDTFQMLCHVTLHWEVCTPYFRREIEDRLERALGDDPIDNPTAAWLLGFSVTSSIALLIALFMFLALTPRR